MTFGRLAALVGIALLVLILNVAMTYLYMMVYGYVIDPGHELAYYEKHVQKAAPYCSIVAGVPLMFLACWWAGRLWDIQLATQSAFIIWAAYGIIDVAIMFAAGMTWTIGVFVVFSLLTKLGAAYLGARFAG